MRKRTAGLLTVALLASAVPPLLLAPPAAAAAAKYADDFNGDGYRDLALGDPTATVGGKKEAGAVVVVWGSATGLDTAKRTVVTQNTPNVAGTAETGDSFGADITTVDLDKDGYGDVIATAPAEADGSYHGTFTVLWGSRSGLTRGSSHHNPACKTCGFAKDLAVGDFNGDGRQDVVAVDDEHIWYLRGPFTKSGGRGAATNLDPVDGEDINPELVVSGKVTKDGTADFAVIGYDADTWTNRVWFYRGGAGGPAKPTKKTGLPSSSDVYGISAQIADFDKNGYGDLAVGIPRGGRGGVVHVLRGTSTGPSSTVKTLSQNTAGVPDVSESGDGFGGDVSAWDTNGDGYPDLAVGSSMEMLGGSYFREGAVTVLRGGTSGLTGKNARQYSHATTGVEGEPTEDAWLGTSVLLRDYNRDNRAELVATAPEMGRLHLLRGTASGPTGAGSTLLTAAQLGLGSRPYFGARLAD
ncbi:VCBS repeat-containing protein [Streptomyces sp. NPDC050211]|uniref:FG-GAP and VCBS repeat-containing protein n=1 Tax=Streptomyces sp. NPDC050211 TaxID=3154932 RepID=UPI0034190C17